MNLFKIFLQNSFQLITIASFLLLPTFLYSVDFDDLKDSHTTLYGSEKDSKYRFDALFIEWENWPRPNATHNYFHFFWFASTTDYPKYRKNQILPFYYSIESKVDKREFTSILLLYQKSVEKDGKDFSFWAPILPLYYTSRRATNHHSNYFWLVDTNKNLETNSIDQFWFVPIFFWKENDYFHLAPFRYFKKDKYSIWFPVFFHFGETEKESESGKNFGIPYYHSWSKEKDTLWIANYFSTEIKNTEYYSKTFIPFYHNWNSKESNGTVVFPLYLDINILDKESNSLDNYSANILGLATESSKGLLSPDISIDIGSVSDYYYLDTDISWLYYAFKISNRTSTKIISDLVFQDSGSKSLTINASNNNSTKSTGTLPKLHKKPSFTRENSFSFFGVNLLFGTIGYESADTKRHMRVLPLAWFTYDTVSDDKIYAGPLPLPFVWYTADDIQYRIIFPIYGYQNSEDAERLSYGLFLYLNEKIQNNNTQDTSVLWPFINWHSSDVKTGSRVLPFYWQRTIKEDSTLTNTSIIPPLLVYKNSTLRDETNSSSFYSPYYINTKSVSAYNNETIVDEFTMIPIIYFRDSSNNVYWENYFILFNRYEYSDSKAYFAFPLFLSSQSISTTISNKALEKNSFYSIPFSRSIKSEEGRIQESTVFFPIIPIYYNYTDKTTSHTNLFFFLDWKIENDTLTSLLLFPFYYSPKINPAQDDPLYFHIIPLYFSYNTNNTYEGFIAGLYLELTPNLNYQNFLYLYEYDQNKIANSTKLGFLLNSIRWESDSNRFDFSILYGAIEYEKKLESIDMNLLWLSYKNRDKYKQLNLVPLYYAKDTDHSKTRWFAPLLYYSNQDNTSYTEHSGLGLLYYRDRSYTSEPSLTSILLGTLYYKTVKPSERGYIGQGSLWGGLWEYNTEEDTDYSKFSILKFLFSRTATNGDVKYKILFLEF